MYVHAPLRSCAEYELKLSVFVVFSDYTLPILALDCYVFYDILSRDRNGKFCFIFIRKACRFEFLSGLFVSYYCPKVGGLGTGFVTLT